VWELRQDVRNPSSHYIAVTNLTTAAIDAVNWLKVKVQLGKPRDVPYTVSEKNCGIKSDGIIYRGRAKYRPQHST